jgi:methionyl-tRNA synthetase
MKEKENFWPADIHIIGKDILWFHAVYWPAMLMSAGIDLPNKIFAHGWWTFDKEKISKSRGKVINVDELISITGNKDSIRYFLMRETAFGRDGDFSEHAVKERHNNELADKLGNLVSRVSALAEKYGLEKCDIKELKFDKVKDETSKHMENLEFDKALNEIFWFVDKCNEYIQNKKPWETRDKKVIYELSCGIKDAAILLSPFISESCGKISQVFGFNLNLKDFGKPLKITKVKKSAPLFVKV